MKTLLILFFTCLSYCGIAQNEIRKEYLVAYGQVWGFLKYFHPEPSKLNWDNVLLNDYENLVKCNTDEAFNELISSVIEQCGDYVFKKRVIPDSMKFTMSYHWIENGLFNSENSSYLSQLLVNKPKFKNKYIVNAAAGNPKVKNEINYENYKSESSIHYLAITRYWNLINYYYPYRDIIPKNWNQVYEDNLFSFIEAKNYEEYYFAIRKLTTELRDGHGFILAENDPLDQYRYAPFELRRFSDGYFIDVVLQDSLKSIDLKRKDRLVSINGIPIEERIEGLRTLVPTSNDYYLSHATYYLQITNQDSITITIERNETILTKTYSSLDKKAMQSRYPSRKSDNESTPYAFLKDSISGESYCYLNLGSLQLSDIKNKFKRKLLRTENVIIDVRNYPNSTLIKLSKTLIKGKRKFAKFKEMNIDYPGSYNWTKSQTIGNKKKGYDGNIYVLVDYITMSQAEYTVMALQQHPYTVVVGGQTAGADGNISKITLPFGVESFFSGLGVFYPDGKPTQQIGIKRDYEVIQNSFYLNGRDVILEKALELMRKEE